MTTTDQTNRKTAEAPLPEDRLCLAPEALRTVWPNEESRPSLRTFDRWRKAKIIPSIKLGALRYFSPPAVKAALLARQVGGAR